MAFVSATERIFSDSTVSFSQAVGAGDVLVVVLSAARFEASTGEATLDRLEVPAGWQRVGRIWDGRASGRPGRKDMAAMVVWHRATAAGTVSATFSWPGPVTRPAWANVLRYSGMRGVRGVAWQRSSWGVDYPAVLLPEGQVASPAGHAVRVAVSGQTADPAGLVPPGHTSRAQQMLWSGWIPLYQRYESHEVIISDQSLSNVTPGQVRASVAAGTSWGVTLYLASTHGPKAPVLDLAPGIHDLSRAWTLGWTPDGAQTGVRVTRQALDSSGEPTGSVEYLSSVSSPAWTTTATTVTTTTTQVAFPAAHWPAAGARFRITVATVGGAEAPDLGDTASVDVESWQGPTATVAKASGVTSGTIADRVPWLVVEGTAGSGAALDLCEVEAVEDGTGRILAAGTHGPGWWYEVPATPEEALPNGAVFRVRGRVRQRGVQWSPWITSGLITVDAPRPPTPTISTHPITHPVSGLPGIGVAVTSVAGDVTVRRDGETLDTWESTGLLTIEDYTPPTDTPIEYAATVSTGSPLPEESLPATTTATLVVPARAQWLIDPRDPAAAVRVWLKSIDTINHDPRVSAYQPLNSARWITHALGRVHQAGSMTVQTLDRDGTEAALALLTSGRRLILRVGLERDGRNGLWPHGLTPFAVTSPVAEERPTQSASWRALSFNWVAQP